MPDSFSACSKRCRAVTRISIARRSRLAAAEDMGRIIEATSLSDSRDPGLDRLPHFSQPPFEEMIRTLDDDQFLRLRKRLHKTLKFRARPELIAVAAHEQFGFHATAKKLEIVNSIVNCGHRQT